MRNPEIILAAACFFVVALAGSNALADEFICRDITLTRQVPASPIVKNGFTTQTTLHLNINTVKPGLSTLRWSGDPAMEGVTSTWPDDAHIIVENGIIATSFYASKHGVLSVGTSTLDAGGVLRITESTLSQQGVIFDVVEAKCHKGAD